jgi:hypothetical protein
MGQAVKPVMAKIDPQVDMKTAPLDQVNRMPAGQFFSYAAELLRVNSPHITDQPIIARMRRLGIEAGKGFDYDNASATVKAALEQAAKDGFKDMYAKIPTLARVVNGWQLNTDTMGVYGTYYLKRAIVALVGLGANLPEDAVYPINIGDSEGKPLDGANNYVLHLTKDELPPVDAFWSVTMYDKDDFTHPNSIDRCAIGDRDALKYNSDGSLHLYLQHESPGSDKESNWLPAPMGPLGVTMRCYGPRPAILNGTWAPPAIRKAAKSRAAS